MKVQMNRIVLFYYVFCYNFKSVLESWYHASSVSLEASLARRLPDLRLPSSAGFGLIASTGAHFLISHLYLPWLRFDCF